MLMELPDERLARIIPEDEYLRLKARMEQACAKIEQDAPDDVYRYVMDLLLILREVEMRLLEDRFRDQYLAYSYVSKAPIVWPIV